MSDTKKLVVKDSYEDTLTQKDKSAQKGQKNSFKSQAQTVTLKNQKKIQQKLAEIKWYRENLDRAEKGVKSGIYNIIDKLMLMGFIITFPLTVILFLCNFERDIILMTLVLSFIFLAFSSMSQSKSLKLEREIKEYSAKLKRAKRELLDLKVPPQS